MSTEQLYITLKLTNNFLDVFQYLFLLIFLLIIIFIVINKNNTEEISVRKLIKEILFSLLSLFILSLKTNISIFTPIIMWALVLGILLGTLHSFSIRFFKDGLTHKISRRYLFAILWGVSILLIAISILYFPTILNVLITLISINVGIITGINILLCIRLKEIKKNN